MPVFLFCFADVIMTLIKYVGMKSKLVNSVWCNIGNEQESYEYSTLGISRYSGFSVSRALCLL